MVAKFPERIVCLTEETTEVLYLLGEQDRIVGISGFTIRPPQARKEKPKVSGLHPSAKVDKILALEPDEVKSCDILQPGPAALTDGLTQLREIIRGWHQTTQT